MTKINLARILGTATSLIGLGIGSLVSGGCTPAGNAWVRGVTNYTILKKIDGLADPKGTTVIVNNGSGQGNFDVSTIDFPNESLKIIGNKMFYRNGNGFVYRTEPDSTGRLFYNDCGQIKQVPPKLQGFEK
jgi:hypothetical protein